MKIQPIDNSQSNTNFNGIRHYCRLGSYCYSTSIVEKAVDNSKVLQKYITNNDVDIELISDDAWRRGFNYMELKIKKLFPEPPKPTKLIDNIKSWFYTYETLEETIKIVSVSNEGGSISLQKDLAERINKIQTDVDLERYIHRTRKLVDKLF